MRDALRDQSAITVRQLAVQSFVSGARVRTALRRRLQVDGATLILRSGNLTVDLVRSVATVRGAEVKLSPREYEILTMLVRHAGKVRTHRHILDRKSPLVTQAA